MIENYDSYVEELVEICHRSYDRGLVSGTSGNISVKLPNGDVLITPTGVSLGEVTKDEIIKVDVDGKVLEGDYKPSKETGFHTGIYRKKPEVNAVAHLHPPYIIAFATEKGSLPLVTVTSRANLKDIQTVESFPAGSKGLAESVINSCVNSEETNVILMKEHGMISMGKSLNEAYFLADIVEDTAKVALYMSLLNKGSENSD